MSFGNTNVPRKLGRNEPCRCGSGLKYKKCCLRKSQTLEDRILVSKNPSTGFVSVKQAPAEVRAKAVRFFEEQQRKERDRVIRFGQVRPQISMRFKGQRVVAVGSKIYHSDKWKFFADFLRDYVPEVFGIEWCRAEAAKPEAERHPVITWRALGARHMNALPPQPDGSRFGLPSGAAAAFRCFAYDLYVVDNNGGLDPTLLERLKDVTHFQGARHELFAEATCLRAGFTVQHENEKDTKTRHVEFTALHTATGQLLSVEAKSKHREGVLAMPGEIAEKPSFTFARLINDAVDKRPHHPLVIFLDTNLPHKWAERWLGRKADNTVSRPVEILLDEINKQHNGKDPYSLLMLSNNPHHYEVDYPDPGRHLFGVVGRESQANLIALQDLLKAANLYGNIPNGFSADEEPLPPVNSLGWAKVRYDFNVCGTEVSVLREGKVLPQTFSTTEKDHPKSPSKLHEFLEDIGLSRVDAHMICDMIEKGNSVQRVCATK